MSELARRVEALRRPLLFAAADGFAGMDRVRDLGGTLRAAVDRLASVAPADKADGIVKWRRVLEHFEQLDVDRQTVEVARGLRLCSMLGADAPRPAVQAPVASTTRSPRAKSGVARDLASAGAAPAARKKPSARAGAAKNPPARGERAKPAAVPEPTSELERPVTDLPGIGPAMAERLAERGLFTIEDMVWYVPRRYDDVRRVESLAVALTDERVAGEERITVSGEVARVRFNRNRRARWVDARIRDPEGGADSPELVVRWFNAHGGMARQFPAGSDVVLSGKVRARAGAVEMANPDVLRVRRPDGSETGGEHAIIARYTDVVGVPPAKLRKACRAAVDSGGRLVTDGVPSVVAERLQLGSLAEALAALHDPPGDTEPDQVEALNEGTSPWQRRLAFDELFFLGLAIADRRRERRSDSAPACAQCDGLLDRVHEALPFEMTGAQRRAVSDIAGDMARTVPMNRLLQGDVGAGKTAVAFAAAVQAAQSGLQVAIMAPTEILAEQHAAGLTPWCRALGLECALLTASTPAGVRQSTLSLLQGGKIDVVVGTHALISDGVAFNHLGLAIVDEQHRFGVAQRVRLRDKGADGQTPHLLVMTATPIPRTLALTAYGDLDVTVLDELPPGRTPPVTRVLGGKTGRDRAYKAVARCVDKGQRAFVVCPLVEPSLDEQGEPRPWADATTVAEELGDRLAPMRVGLVHGRLRQDERDATMDAFRRGDLDVLVATTVIEVGVDVPEAALMIIEDADRFGLAQLHQLRGRVGRGGGASACLLLTRGRKTATGVERLSVMAETCDGFAIAEHDLRIRGPGELLGARQSGLPRLRFGDLQEHVELLVAARAEADALLETDPTLERHPVTREVLAARIRAADIYGAEGG